MQMQEHSDAPFWCAGGCGREWIDQGDWWFWLDSAARELKTSCPDCYEAPSVTAAQPK